MRLKLILEYIRKILLVYVAGRDVGLSPHLRGPKGPCLLILEQDRLLASQIAEGVSDIAELKISTEIIFLGVIVYIDKSHGVTVTSITPKSKQMLAFFSTQLVRALKLLTAGTNKNRAPDQAILKAASQSISAYIESRIQYNVAFCDSDSIDYYFNIHKRVVSATLGHSANFFGFKWRTSPKKYVQNLFDYLDNLCSPTYIRICQLSGRPTLLDLARRATRVIEEQFIAEQHLDYENGETESLRPRKPKFVAKIQSFNELYDAKYGKIPAPRENEYFELLAGCSTVKQRSAAVRLSTDTLLRSHLGSRGFELDTTCTQCDPQNTHTDTFRHLLEHISIEKHHLLPLSSKFKRKIQKICTSESEQLAMPNKRIRLNIEPQMVSFFLQAVPSFDFRPPKSMKCRKMPSKK